MTVVYLLLLLTGAILFALEAFSVVVGRFNLVALGLLAWVLVPLLQVAQKL